MKYHFKLFVDSDLAKELWDEGMVLESEFEQSEKTPPKATEVVEDAVNYVFQLDDNSEEHRMLRKVFEDALQNGHSFNVKIDLDKSSS